MDVRMRSGVPRASKQAIEAASRMEKKIGEAEKKDGRKAGWRMEQERGTRRVVDRRGKKHDLGG